MRLVVNPVSSRSAYGPAEAEIVSYQRSEEALGEIETWEGYAPTPLRDLPALAARLGIGGIFYKDESGRLGQGSFKILGGAYAAELALREATVGGAKPTLCCATDGNHGRSVAFAARKHGCDSVVLMHVDAPKDKAAAIEALGAKLVWIDGSYDDSVRAADRMARDNGWLLIADTSTDTEDPTTRRVMQGYGVMVLELLDQLGERRPTHVFLQGGVGGLAAGVAGVLADTFGADRPTAIVVEPETAACLFESALQFSPAKLGGDISTAMAMLSTGEASPVAWPILQQRADAFVTISDDAAIEAARMLEDHHQLDVGVSGAAGMAGLIEVMASPAARAVLGLDGASRVLLFGTEGAPPKAGA